MSTSIEQLPSNTINSRIARGLWAPLSLLAEESVIALDCADERDLTEPIIHSRRQRHVNDIFSAGYFGAAAGLALTDLVAFASVSSEAALKSFMKEAGPNVIPALAVNLALGSEITDRSLEMTVHSAEHNEGNTKGLAIDNEHARSPILGCAFLASMGPIIGLSLEGIAVDDAKRVDSILGYGLPLDDVRSGLTILTKYLTATYGVRREQLLDILGHNHNSSYLKVSMVQGNHASNTKAKVTFDMLGLARSSALLNAAGIPRYHHSAVLAKTEISKLTESLTSKYIPPYPRESDVLLGASLLLASATRTALSGAATPYTLGIEIVV